MIFVDWFSPGYKGGGPIQSCKNFVEAFKDDFQLFIITSDRDLGDSQPYPGLIINTWTRQPDDVRIFYASIKDLGLGSLKELVKEVHPDYIYLNSMFSYKLTILPLLLRIPQITGSQIIIAPRGMLHEGALRFKPLKKKAVYSTAQYP